MVMDREAHTVQGHALHRVTAPGLVTWPPLCLRRQAGSVGADSGVASAGGSLPASDPARHAGRATIGGEATSPVGRIVTPSTTSGQPGGRPGGPYAAGRPPR